MLLKVSGLGSIGSGVFDLHRGLNAVVGPNGSGKSTLVNALYFAFTGETLNSENIDTLITWGTSQCSIKLELSDNFIIERCIQKGGTSKSKLQLGEKTITRKKEIDSALCELFGFSDLSILRMVFFAEQYKAIDIVDSTDSVRLQFLSSLFGFSRMEKLRTLLQDAVNSLDVSVVGDEVLEKLRDGLVQAEQRRDSMIAKQSELSSRVLSADELNSLTKTVNAPDVGTRDALLKELDNCKAAAAACTERLSVLPGAPTIQEDSEYAAIMRHRELSRSMLEASSKLQECEARVGLSPEAISEFLRQLSVNKTSLQTKKADIESRATLVSSGKCPLTGGLPCPDLKAMTNEQTLREEVLEIDRQLEDLNKDYSELQSAFTEATKVASDVAAARAVLHNIESALSSLQINVDFDVKGYEQRKAGADAVHEERSKLLADLANVNAAVVVAEEKLSALSDTAEASPEDKEEARKRLLQNTQALSALAELGPLISEFEKSAAEQRSSLQSAEDQNSIAAVRQKKRNQLSSIRLALHRDNLPRLLVTEMLQALNAKLSFYLSKFNFPYSVIWTADGGIIYSDGSDDWHRVSQLSGGQKYVFVISFRCALADMLSSSFPFFVMDEPTTGLDVDNRAALSEVLQRVVEQFPNRYIVVPTHDEMLLPEANIIEVGR